MDEFDFPDIPPWFWYVGIGLAVGCAALLVLWYLQHPDRSPWSDFAKPIDVVATNGSVPHTATSPVRDAPQSTAEGTPQG